MESWDNFAWLASLHEFLTDEYSYRYRKIHATTSVVDAAYKIFEDNIPTYNIDITKFPMCMPDHFKCFDVIKAYRRYYIGDKMHLCKYTNRPIPDWMEEEYESRIPKPEEKH